MEFLCSLTAADAKSERVITELLELFLSSHTDTEQENTNTDIQSALISPSERADGETV